MYWYFLNWFFTIWTQWFFFNCIIIVASLVGYGYTTAGMTYNLFGDNNVSGVVILLVNELLKQKVSLFCINVNQFSLSFSLVEIYKETVLDLLDKHAVLSIHESADHIFFVNSKQISFLTFSDFTKVPFISFWFYRSRSFIVL